MTLIRTFLANSGVLSMGPSQDSDRSLSKNIGAAVDGTGKPIQDVKMSDYYESVVDSDNVTQVIDGGNPVAMSDFRNKTGKLTQESVNTTIDNRSTKIIKSTRVTTYGERQTCKVSGKKRMYAPDIRKMRRDHVRELVREHWYKKSGISSSSKNDHKLFNRNR